MNAFNISTRRVGGIRFVRIGRLCFSFCVCATYRSLTGQRPAAAGASRNLNGAVE